MLLVWDPKQQARFIESVERLVGLVGDLQILLETPKRRRAAVVKANETRTAAATADGDQAAAELPQKG